MNHSRCFNIRNSSRPDEITERVGTTDGEGNGLQRGAESFDDVLRVLTFRDTAITQTTLAFCGLAAQQVSAEGTAVLRFP